MIQKLGNWGSEDPYEYDKWHFVLPTLAQTHATLHSENGILSGVEKKSWSLAA